MLILIDNYDSFTYNLVQYLGELGVETKVFLNDKVNLNDLIILTPTHLVVSPGPGNPAEDSGVSFDAISYFNGKIPILGVCLGHQTIAALHGAKVDRALRVMHGKISSIHHNGKGIFDGVPSPFEAMRYHSLVVYDPVPRDLEVVALTDEKEIMGLRHREYPTFGVQFHPESIMTEHGKKILQNFIEIQFHED